MGEMALSKKILCIDFDGVLHSYKSGWKGPWKIPDPPVRGAIDWLECILAYEEFQVCIFSSRNAQPCGRWAMKRWLRKHGLSRESLKKIRFPILKPAAFLTIDDRTLRFTGEFPQMGELLGFKPWNHQNV